MTVEIFTTDGNMEARVPDVVPAAGRMIAFAIELGDDVWEIWVVPTHAKDRRVTRTLGQQSARDTLTNVASNVLAQEVALIDAVWVPGTTWRPGGHFHSFTVLFGVANQTKCGIKEIQYTGTVVPRREALDDWRQPCEKCFEMPAAVMADAPTEQQQRAAFNYGIEHGIIP